MLFILFINDIKDCINIDKLTESDLQLLSVFMLLFADDITLFTTNPETLQNELNQTEERVALRKQCLNEKTAASVLLKLFISGNERCNTTDAP